MTSSLVWRSECVYALKGTVATAEVRYIGEILGGVLGDAFANEVALAALLEILDPVRRELVLSYYGLGGQGSVGLRAFAGRQGLSLVRVQQLLTTALELLWVELARRTAQRQWDEAQTLEERLGVSVLILRLPPEVCLPLCRAGLGTVGSVMEAGVRGLRGTRGLRWARIELIRAALQDLELVLPY